jgi:short-subunit dehydrogenase
VWPSCVGLRDNAGAGHRGTLEQLTMDDLSQVMELAFLGVARVTKAVLPAMRAARTGRVITVTSLNGVVALPFSDAYNAAKFAVDGLMESLATVMREFRGVHLGFGTGTVRTASSPMSVGTSTTSATTIRTRN